ncbi:uncharacterized protein M421DRAFT_426871 [Didymella exigua CBS 183.55]|uniref:Uncharacterized protein n=1 Tax=Didymella exigua CBS 183.55 TaxID=1150837 RepID=A0A6A5R633_9PLEO|nr:uncharacterized protein M421DRAFT_426871 [Didymella exigua CBS 183.55]KAF1922474.1 hypothetical protein M421DRAFT_426871 [Didymella exigua CBS 183.55]
MKVSMLLAFAGLGVAAPAVVTETVSESAIETGAIHSVPGLTPERPLPASNSPTETLDEDLEWFQDNTYYSRYADKAKIAPYPYELVVEDYNMTAIHQTIATHIQDEYDVSVCATHCNEHRACDAFAIYIEREPSCANCTDPEVVEAYKCDLYNTALQLPDIRKEIEQQQIQGQTITRAVRAYNGYNRIPKAVFKTATRTVTVGGSGSIEYRTRTVTTTVRNSSFTSTKPSTTATATRTSTKSGSGSLTTVTKTSTKSTATVTKTSTESKSAKPTTSSGSLTTVTKTSTKSTATVTKTSTESKSAKPTTGSGSLTTVTKTSTKSTATVTKTSTESKSAKPTTVTKTSTMSTTTVTETRTKPTTKTSTAKASNVKTTTASPSIKIETATFTRTKVVEPVTVTTTHHHTVVISATVGAGVKNSAKV